MDTSHLRLIATALILSASCQSGVLAAGAGSVAQTKGRYVPMRPYEDLSNEENAQDVLKQASAAYQNGRFEQAERLFKKALSLDPKSVDAYYNLGVLSESRGDLKGALEAYRKASAINPGDRSLVQAVSEVTDKIRAKEATLAEEQKARREVDLAVAGQRAGDAFKSGDYYESARQLNVLVKSFPRDANVRFALGQSLRALKQYAWSAYHLKMAIYLQPDNDEYRKTLVELDDEVQTAQQQAILDSAKIALGHLRPFYGGEAVEPGL
ncbi:MAG: tetratricopeptide repeat protein [Candidatus Obscuribacterales bacterium]|nr:tetratricopeptide repeat protein [Candidatus Obscuribacterales bacterium]